MRIVLFAIFGGNALGDSRINLFAITVVVATLLVFWVIVGKVYKNLCMKLLESFFLLNLIILAAATQRTHLLLIRMVLLFFQSEFPVQSYELLNVNNTQLDFDRTRYI